MSADNLKEKTAVDLLKDAVADSGITLIAFGTSIAVSVGSRILNIPVEGPFAIGLFLSDIAFLVFGLSVLVASVTVFLQRINTLLDVLRVIVDKISGWPLRIPANHTSREKLKLLEYRVEELEKGNRLSSKIEENNEIKIDKIQRRKLSGGKNT